MSIQLISYLKRRRSQEAPVLLIERQEILSYGIDG